VLHLKKRGEPESQTAVSWPIHHDYDPEVAAWYTRRPFSVRASYHAHYFRLFHGDKFLVTMPLVVSNATRAGLVYHDGDESHARFHVNVPILQPVVDTLLREHRTLTEAATQTGHDPAEKPDGGP
jgi:hypothetical protein